MSQAWYSQQTANHLIWATALVLLALITLAGLIVWKRHEQAVLYTKLASEQGRRDEAEQAKRDEAERVEARAVLRRD